MSPSFAIPTSSRATRAGHLTIHPSNHSITRSLRSVRSALGRVRGLRSVSTPMSIEHPASIPKRLTPQLVISFVNTLSDVKLSNFLLWFLYHDIVEPPKSPSQWFEPIPDMEMRGWVALGQFLSIETPYGLDLVVFTSCCDRMQLNKNAVHECLVRLSDPGKMAWTLLAASFQEAQQAHMTETATLELVQSKLLVLRALAISLKPAEGSKAAELQAKVISRAHEFLEYVVDLCLDDIRKNESLALCEGDDMIKRNMAYLFEVMQQPREVPLTVYGIYPDFPVAASSTPSWQITRSPPTTEGDIGDRECGVEESSTVMALQSEIGQLRNRVVTLEQEQDRLRKENESLKQQLSQAAPSRSAPTEVGSTPSVDSTEESSVLPSTPTPAPRALRCHKHRFAPPANIQHRRLPTLMFSGTSPQDAPATSSSPPVAQSSDYDDIFRPLDQKARFSLGLSSPLTDATTPYGSEERRTIPRDIGAMDLRATLEQQSSPSGPNGSSDGLANIIREDKTELIPLARVAANPTSAISRVDDGTERSFSAGRAQPSGPRRKASIGNALNSLLRRRVQDKGEGSDIAKNV